jgi:hypothetical protein
MGSIPACELVKLSRAIQAANAAKVIRYLRCRERAFGRGGASEKDLRAD